MTGLVALFTLVLLVAVFRARGARRAEEDVAARLRLGSNGIVEGAEPIDLQATGEHAPGEGGQGGRVVVLLHGFGDTPQTFVYLAAHLHAHGWAVRAPLLPGHGRTMRDFAASRADDWIRCARDEVVAARAQHSTVALVGLSMGGSLATLLAAEVRGIAALVLLAPYLSMPTRLRRAAAAHWLLGAFAAYLPGRGDGSIRDPVETTRSLAYRFTTPRLLRELSTVVSRARAAAPRVGSPTLVIQSRHDARIPTDAAERAFALFTVPTRRLVWTEGNGHIITVDYGRQQVLDLVAEWLSTHATTARVLTPGTAHAAERPRSA